MTDGRPSGKIEIKRNKQYPLFSVTKQKNNNTLFVLLQNTSHYIFGMLAWSFWRKCSAQSIRVK